MDCEVCHAEVPDDDLIVLEGRRVCMACKPLVVQQIKEGCLPPMPSAPIEVSDHELGLPELAWKAWLICRQDWPALLALRVMVPIPSIACLVFYSQGNVARFDQAPVFFLAWLLEYTLTALSVVGVNWVVKERIQGRSLSFSQALEKGGHRWLPAIGTSLLVGLVLGFLTLLLVVPGIMFVVYYAFAGSAVALRHRAGVGALEYSKRLVEGRWWRVAGRLLGLSLPAGTLIMGMTIAMRYLHHPWYVEILYKLSVHVLSIFNLVGTVLLFVNLDTLRQKPRVNVEAKTPVRPRLEEGEIAASED
ncbi:MAG: TraR/DksA C4-type zinc finger protein [Chthoniobacter sp.]|nr:TraR/DksA C4-type zinc finger protein [Chthoniobacter sp.]